MERILPSLGLGDQQAFTFASPPLIFLIQQYPHLACAHRALKSNMSSSGPSKTQSTETSKPDVESAQTSKAASNQAPAMLEEDDEFEDFPVEGIEISPQ